MSEFKFTSDFIIKKLQDMYPVEDYAFFGELRIGTGFAGKDSSGQRFDAYIVHYLKGKRNETTCFEIKVSRQDFQHELSNPNKRRAGQRLSNKFYFVTPKDLVKPEEIPVDCGLMEVDENGAIDIKIPAPYVDVAAPTWEFLAAVARRVNAHSIRDILTKKALEELMESYKQAALSALTNRIEYWKNYQGGDKRLPDRLAEELEYVLHQIIEEAEGKD
jgi:hypothetical protein